MHVYTQEHTNVSGLCEVNQEITDRMMQWVWVLTPAGISWWCCELVCRRPVWTGSCTACGWPHWWSPAWCLGWSALWSRTAAERAKERGVRETQGESRQRTKKDSEVHQEEGRALSVSSLRWAGQVVSEGSTSSYLFPPQYSRHSSCCRILNQTLINCG